MSAPQFDPAPWSVEPNTDAGSPPSLMVTTRDAVIAEVYADVAASEPVCQANAHLIAAAPEFYAELEQWLFLFDSGQITGSGLHAFADRTRALLAKARGEA